MGAVISLMSGAVAALIAGGNSYAVLCVGILLLALGIVKAAMSWPHVPIWYHIVFTAMLLPMALLGGRLVAAS